MLRRAITIVLGGLFLVTLASVPACQTASRNETMALTGQTTADTGRAPESERAIRGHRYQP